MVIDSWFARFCRRLEQRKMRRLRRVSHSPYAHVAAECLEVRALLSNIAVTVQSGDVTLAGDTGDHTFTASVVTISSVQNLELVGTAGTQFTYNNTTSATLDIPLSSIGTIQELNITMQGGNDTATIDATNLPSIAGPVAIQLGDGANSLTFYNATVAGHMNVTSGSGNDALQMTGDTIGSLSISTGDGTDAVTLSTVTINGQPSSMQSHHGEWFGRWWCGGGNHHGWDDDYDGGSLTITTGNGDNDTVTLNSVVGDGNTSNGSGHAGEHCGWGGRFGKAQWQITLGTGTSDQVALNSVTAPQSLSVRVESGSNSQIDVASSTVQGRTSLSTGFGDSQTIAVNDSTFNSATRLSMGGSNATLNVEHGSIAGPGTVFQAPVVAHLSGPSAVANLGGPAPNNTLTFASFLAIFGGDPAATVNIATATTTLDDNRLHLRHANRVNV